MASDEPDNPPDPSSPPPVLQYQSPGGSGGRWTTVWKAANPAEANLAVNHLQSHGLHARVDFEHSAQMGVFMGVVGGTSVQVLSHDTVAAELILREIETKREERRLSWQLKCPKCETVGPKRILSRIRYLAFALIAASFVLSGWDAAFCVPLGAVGVFILVWPVTPTWRCRSCRHVWRALEPEEPDDDDPSQPSC